MTARKTSKNNHRYASDDNHSATRKYIISTAYDLFREKGYAKASMSELARRINMDPSSLYYYFPSKEALLAELCDPAIDTPSLDKLRSYTNSYTVALYALIMMDVVRKCELPLDFIDVESAARKNPINSIVSICSTKHSIQRYLLLLNKASKKANSATARQMKEL